MARQKKSKKGKIKLPARFEDLKDLILKKMIVAFVVILFLVVTLFLVKAFLEGSGYFTLKQIEVKCFAEQGVAAGPLSNELLKLYKDRNIFKINLKNIAGYLQAKYPNAKHVIVTRSLPDKIVASFYFRKPVAIVGESRYYPVDDEGFIISNAGAATLKDLPVIAGVDIRSSEVVARIIESKNLKAALELLKEIKNARFMAKYRVSRIEADDVKTVSFYINDLEIRIGNENLKERLARFRKMLKDPRFAMGRIKYIDLRFEDVVIGPK